MNLIFWRRATPLARLGPLAALFAGLIIFGCGGGGGGGSSSNTSQTATATSATGTVTGTAGTLYGANEIVYGLPSADGSTFSLDQMKPDGSANSILLSGISSDIALFAQIPGAKNQFVSLANTNANVDAFGLYLSTGLSTTTTTLVAPIYSNVSSLTVTADGAHIVYVASLLSDLNNVYYLWVLPIKGGTPVNYGPADGATVSPADSDTIAYVAVVASTGLDQVYTRSLNAGVSGSSTLLTTDSSNHVLPAFNRTGTQLAYWEQSSSASTLIVETLASQSKASLPNPNKLTPQGESFSADGTEIAIAADANLTGEILTQPVTGSSNPTVILSNKSVDVAFNGVYWTDSSGRGLIQSIMSSTARGKRRLSSASSLVRQ